MMPPIESVESRRVLGRVQKYFVDRGYGFIALECPPRGDTRNCWFGWKNVEPEGPLLPGAYVTCEVSDGPRGPRAARVRQV